MADAVESGTKGEAKQEKGFGLGKIQLFELSGIRITIDYSWLIIFLLVMWSLSAGYFPMYYPGYTTYVYWLAGLVATLFFFASIVIHEFSHSLIALRSGIKIPEITLFVFGGMAKMSQDPTKPMTELKMAAAGPLASFVLAGIFWAITAGLRGGAPNLIVAIFEYLAWINVALAVFNLVPGYPLDGGRILRAVIWWRTGSIARATKWASDVGKGFAWALMILGGFEIFTGALIGGLWLLFIGMFLRGIAAGGYQEVMIKQSLEGVRVDQVMVDKVITVPPDTTLDDLTRNFFLRYGHGGFPVVRDGQALGVVSLRTIKDVPEDEKPATTAEKVMNPLTDQLKIGPRDSLADALKKMTQGGVGRLLVMDGDSMIGMITKTGLLRFLEMKRILEP